MGRYATKEGKHGTLIRFAVTYRDEHDAANAGVWHCWAYDAEHAALGFMDSPDAEGWEITGVRKAVLA